MEIAQAVDSTLLILDDETVRPTIQYRYVGEEWPGVTRWQEQDLRDNGYTPMMAGVIALAQMRMGRPRPVEEDPQLWRFESANFNLLLIILNRVLNPNRAPFIRALLSAALEEPPLALAERNSDFPSWNGNSSGLGLLAEFCIRTGHSQVFFDSTHQVKAPSTAVAIMVRQIEEIFALNFTIFSEAEVETLPEHLASLRRVAYQQTYWANSTSPGEPPIGNPDYIEGLEHEGQEIVKSIDAITAQCKQARYFYLKGALQETTNLEVESDKTKVIGFLDSLGFDPLLTASLAKAESLYSASSDAFDLKSCLGHIRSFYEHLNIDTGLAIAKALGKSVVDEWDPTLTFLKNNSFLSMQQDKFARGLYALLSDEGVHPLIAQREFARLLRNMVIEYGLMFLTMLDKKGVKLK